MGVITDMLREHQYTEWDGEHGNMIGASYGVLHSPCVVALTL